jgi:D-threo-aldose 1-dehydrogenase
MPNDTPSALPTLILPNERTTTRLGFGCAYLSPETAWLVDVAYEAGIRHFDVAPAYGRGLNEGVLGAALAGKDATITTKFGIEPAYGSNVRFALRVRWALRPILLRLPAVHAHMSKRVSQRAVRARFEPEPIRASIERSLAALKRESLDILLLHEVSADELCEGALVAFLEDCRERGLIGAFGIGGTSDRTFGVVERFPDLGHVVQHEWSPDEPNCVWPLADLSIFYRTTSLAPLLRIAFAQNGLDARVWSNALDCDVMEVGALEGGLLRLSLDTHPDTLILFSSRKAEHIHANILAATDQIVGQRAAKLAVLLADEAEVIRSDAKTCVMRRTR